MCRNIRTLFNFEPPATEDEIRASALQFVRKLSGFAHPSRANEVAFDRAVDEVTDAARRLLDALSTASPAKKSRSRSDEGARARKSAVCVSGVIPGPSNARNPELVIGPATSSRARWGAPE
jgi:hypothetical protein